MVAIPEGAPSTNFVLAGFNVGMVDAFAEGHVCLPNEAGALNQLLRENCRNNIAKRVGPLREQVTKGELTEEDATAEVQKMLDEYVVTYEFGVRSVGTGAPVDPITGEMLKLAKADIKAILKEKGIAHKKLVRVDETGKQIQSAGERITEMAHDLMAKPEHGERLRKAAEEILKAREDSTVEALADIDLGI